MKPYHGRRVASHPYRSFGPDDDARLRPLAFERSARMAGALADRLPRREGRAVCFVCDAIIPSEDELGRPLIGGAPPILVAVEVGLMLHLRACDQHLSLERWPAADYELASWMVRNGWGEPMDPAMLGDVQ